MGSGAKSYMRKGFPVHGMRKCANISPYMRRPLVIYCMTLNPIPNFLRKI